MVLFIDRTFEILFYLITTVVEFISLENLNF